MGGSRLDVEIVGKGRDLVCLHSLLSDKSSFHPLAERIGDRRRLILVNLPGFGASPRAATAIEVFADKIAQLFRDLSLPPETDVVGNGLGGFVALALAARHGALFRRAVLVGGAARFPEVGRVTFRALADKAEREGMATLAEAAMQRMFPPPFIAANPAVVAGRAAVFRRIDPTVFAAAARALAELDLGAELQQVRNPVLIVVGELDGATPPALARELGGRIAGAKVVEMPGLGHCPHIQDTDAFVGAVADFLQMRSQPLRSNP
jgi:3-oxoadipate enol-lactonase